MTNVSEFLKKANPAYNPEYPMTDIGSGRLFYDCFKDEIAYVGDGDGKMDWIVYENGIWKPVKPIELMKRCMVLSEELLKYARTVPDHTLSKLYQTYAEKWQRARYIQFSVLPLAAARNPISAQSFNRDPALLNLKNGTINLDKMQFKEHTPKDLLFLQANASYDSSAKCERFLSFINEIFAGDESLSHFVRKCVGYSLYGRPKEDVMFLLWGRERSGKGTLCYTIHNLLGSYAASTRPEAFYLKHRSGPDLQTEYLSRLNGVRFSDVSELTDGKEYDESLIKQWTGSDYANTRALYQNSQDFVPSVTFFFHTNHLPTFKDQALLESGRIAIIPFFQKFTLESRDTTLRDQFSTEEAMSGILNWALQGWVDYQNEGLSEQPFACQQAFAQKYLQANVNSSVSEFANDCLITAPDESITTASAYKLYVAYCKSKQWSPVSIKRFSSDLKANGFELFRGHPITENGRQNTATLIKDVQLRTYDMIMGE